MRGRSRGRSFGACSRTSTARAFAAIAIPPKEVVSPDAWRMLRALSTDGRDVAIKLLKRPKDLTKLQRFERERRLLELLGEDEGFVPVLEQGESSRGPYIVMPFLPGGSLRERLDEKHRLSIATSVELARLLAKAAGEAHARGIVHRDLKPANVLFTRAGRPLIAA